MVREDLIDSAVAFLRDPSVAASPLDKRKAFLESKNLTTEEIELALSRAGEDAAVQGTPAPTQANYGYSGQSYPRAPPPPPPSYGYNYGPYQGGQWAQQAQEPPRRDWRDWFIMATATTGVGYGLYTIAKRYVMPLIAPPTPPQIEQDKAAIDESFSRAFALIDQLASDTSALKSAEAERSERLDAALQEVESVLGELKTANKRREEESRRIGDDVHSLKDMIPKALEGWKADGDARLKELGSELKSLKTLVGNRVGGQSASSPTIKPPGIGYGDRNATNNTNGMGEKQEDVAAAADSAPAPAAAVPRRDSSSPFGRPGGRAAIPAWQMAAASKAKGTGGGDGNAGGGAEAAAGA